MGGAPLKSPAVGSDIMYDYQYGKNGGIEYKWVEACSGKVCPIILPDSTRSSRSIRSRQCTSKNNERIPEFTTECNHLA